jgi:hypothetical protein
LIVGIGKQLMALALAVEYLFALRRNLLTGVLNDS